MHIILGTLSLLILATIPFLNAGESNIADFILSATPPLILLTLLITARKGKPPQTSKALVWYVLLIFLWGIYSAFHSVSLIESALSLWKELSIFSFLLVAGSVLNQKTILPQVSRIFSLVAVCLAIISFFFLLPGIKPYNVDTSFFYSTYGHNRLAEYLLIIFPLISVYLLVDLKKLFIGKIVWLTVLLSFLLTFSRLGVALLVLGPLIAFVANKNLVKRYFSNRLVVVIVFILGLLLSSMLVTVFMGNTQIQSLRTVSLFTKPLGIIPRVEYFQYTLQKSLERPWTGFGPGTYQYNTETRFADSKPTAYAHNHLLHKLYETGFPGFTIEIFFLAIFFSRAFKRVRETNSAYLLAAFVGVTLSFLHSMFDFGWQIGAVRLTSLFLLLLLQSEEERNKVNVFWAFPLIITPLLFLIFISFNPVFNRDKYKQRIDYFDSVNNLDESASLLALWEKIDWGNSQMYQYLARRDLELRNYDSAVDNLILSYFAPLRNEWFPFDVSDRLIDAYLLNPTAVDPERMFSLLEVVSRAFSPHDFYWYPTASYTQKIELILGDLETRLRDPGFSDSTQSLIKYWRFSLLLSKDEGNIDEIYSLIRAAHDLNPDNDNYRIMEKTTSDLINPRMEDLVLRASEISRISFGDGQKADSYQFLLALTFQKMALLQAEAGRIEDSITSLWGAIEAMPYFGSSYLELALAYHRLGKEAEAVSVVLDCQRKVSPDCLSWYDERVVSQSN